MPAEPKKSADGRYTFVVKPDLEVRVRAYDGNDAYRMVQDFLTWAARTQTQYQVALGERRYGDSEWDAVERAEMDVKPKPKFWTQ